MSQLQLRQSEMEKEASSMQGMGRPLLFQVSVTDLICFIVVSQRGCCCEISLYLITLHSSDWDVCHKCSS